MDQGLGSCNADQASLRSVVKSVVNTYQTEMSATKSIVTQTAFAPTISRDAKYDVADSFGRCFLRVCFWLDVFTSLAMGYEGCREEPQPFVAPSLEAAVPPLAEINATTESASDGLATA